MMQANSQFIENFAKKSTCLRALTKGSAHFQWKPEHERCFQMLLKELREDTLLRYFDLEKPTFIFTDAHKTGLGATLAQGDSIANAQPVAFASRTTNHAETRYPQLDLEAMSIDFGMRRFRNYILGSPTPVTVVTDHKPLLPVFNGSRPGSIRTERIKMRHQDVRYQVVYQKGSQNRTDYISRHAKPLTKLPLNEKTEATELNNLLYSLHTKPIIGKSCKNLL